MKIEVKRIECNPEKIAGSRDFAGATKYMAARFKAYCDPYVPFRSGHLKNTAFVGKNYVRYLGPYAQFQYGGVVMVGIMTHSPWARRGEPKRVTGKPLSYSGGGQRGPNWDKRMMEQRGDELRQDVANYLKAKSKK